MDTSEYDTYYDDNFEQQEYDEYLPEDNDSSQHGERVVLEETLHGNQFPKVTTEMYGDYNMDPDSLDTYASGTQMYDGSVGHNVHRALGKVMEYMDQVEMTDVAINDDIEDHHPEMKLTTSKLPVFPELESVLQPDEGITQHDQDLLDIAPEIQEEEPSEPSEVVYTRESPASDRSTKSPIVKEATVNINVKPLSVQEKLEQLQVSNQSNKNSSRSNHSARGTHSVRSSNSSTSGKLLSPTDTNSKGKTVLELPRNIRKCLCQLSRLQMQPCGAADCVSKQHGSEFRRSTLVSQKNVRQRESHQAFVDWKLSRKDFSPHKENIPSRDEKIAAMRGRPNVSAEKAEEVMQQYRDQMLEKEAKTKRVKISELKEKQQAQKERQQNARRVFKQWKESKETSKREITKVQKQLRIGVPNSVKSDQQSTVKLLSKPSDIPITKPVAEAAPINPYTLRRTLGALGVARSVPVTVQWSNNARSKVVLGGSTQKHQSHLQTKVYMESLISVKKQMALRTLLRELRGKVHATLRVQHLLRIVLGKQNWWRTFVILATPEQAPKASMEHVYKVKEDVFTKSKKRAVRIQMQKAQNATRTTEVSVLELLVLCNVLARAQLARKEAKTENAQSQRGMAGLKEFASPKKRVMKNVKLSKLPGVKIDVDSSSNKIKSKEHIVKNSHQAAKTITTHTKVTTLKPPVPIVNKVKVNKPHKEEFNSVKELELLQTKQQSQMLTKSDVRRPVLSGSAQNSPFARKGHTRRTSSVPRMEFNIQNDNNTESKEENNVQNVRQMGQSMPVINDTAHVEDDEHDSTVNEVSSHFPMYNTYTDEEVLHLRAASTTPPPARQANNGDWYAGLSPQVQAILRKHESKTGDVAPYSALQSSVPTYNSTGRIASHSAATQEQQKTRYDNKKTVLDMIQDHEKQPRHMTILPDNRQSQFRYQHIPALTSSSVRTTLRPPLQSSNNNNELSIQIHVNDNCPHYGQSSTYRLAYTQSLRALDQEDCCCEKEFPISEQQQYEKYDQLERHDNAVAARAQAILDKYR